MLLAVLLTVLFVGLKLTGYIAWSWFWVVSPIPIAIVLNIAVIILVLGGAAAIVGAVAEVSALLDRHDRNKRIKQRQATLGLFEDAAQRTKNVTPKR